MIVFYHWRSHNLRKARALRCCVRPWRLPLGEAQIALSPILHKLTELS
ncbi:MAG: hypothetical protein ICV55_10555 [Coleofasciculus sp. C3-bin4]|nr:hypothetical protein [Coleofasciculus sp. C3-bin4]